MTAPAPSADNEANDLAQLLAEMSMVDTGRGPIVQRVDDDLAADLAREIIEAGWRRDPAPVRIALHENPDGSLTIGDSSYRVREYFGTAP